MSTSENLNQRTGGTLPPQQQPNPAPQKTVVVPYNYAGPLAPNEVRASPPAPSQPNPVPPKPASPQYNTQGPWQSEGTIVAEKEVPAHTYAPQGASPYQVQTQTVYELGPVPTDKAQPSGLDLAKQQEATNAFAQEHPSAGTTNPLANTVVPTGQTKETMFGKVPVVTNPTQQSIYANLSPQDQALLTQYQQQKTVTSMTNLGLFLGASTAFAVAPETALIGAGIGSVASPAISEGANLIQGRGFLSNNQFVNSVLMGFTGGAIFSVAGSEITGALGLSGASGLGGAAGRVGVNTALGAGGGAVYEYASTGKVTAMGPTEGAAFGLAFGLGGEAIRAYAPARLQNLVASRTITKEADLIEMIGGKSTGIYSEDFTTDITESSRQTIIDTKVTVIKDQSYVDWLEDFKKSFTPQELELSGQGTKSVYNTKSFEGSPDTAMSPIDEGARGMRVKPLDAEAFLKGTTSSDVTDTYVEHGEPKIGNEYSIVASDKNIAESAAKIGTNDNPSDLTNRVTVERNTYNSARVLGEMTPEAAARLQKNLTEGNFVQPDTVAEEKGPMKPMDYDFAQNQKMFKPYYKPEQQGTLSYQQQINLPRIAPQITEVPVSTDIVDVNIREITQSRPIQVISPTFAGVMSQSKINAPTIMMQTPLNVPKADTEITPVNMAKTAPTLDFTQTPALSQTPIQIPRQSESVVEYTDSYNKAFQQNFSFPGSQSSMSPQNPFTFSRRTGLRSTKRLYPILTAKEFIDAGIGFKKVRGKKRLGDL